MSFKPGDHVVAVQSAAGQEFHEGDTLVVDWCGPNPKAGNEIRVGIRGIDSRMGWFPHRFKLDEISRVKSILNRYD